MRFCYQENSNYMHDLHVCFFFFTINAHVRGYLLCVKRDIKPCSDRSELFESFLRHEGRKVHAWEGSSGGRLIEYTEYTARQGRMSRLKKSSISRNRRSSTARIQQIRSSPIEKIPNRNLVRFLPKNHGFELRNL